MEVLETLSFEALEVYGEYDSPNFRVLETNGGVDPIDTGCLPVGRCIGAMTRDMSLDLESRYGCTRPVDDELVRLQSTCSVSYDVSESSSTLVTISSVKIALHPDSVTTLSIVLNGDESDTVEWEAAAGTTGMQEISTLQGLRLSSFEIEGVMEVGEYLGILETSIFVDVEEVEVVGTPASNRHDVTATATSDADSAMATVDGAPIGTSAWTCSEEVCEITYDLQAPESVEQLRIVISEDTDAGGSFNFLAAGESGEFYAVRLGVEAGGRTPDVNGFQTFGGVRAVARYVKIEAVPASGGAIVISEVEIRIGVDAPIRPVAEKAWLKPTGLLPRGGNPSGSDPPDFDARTVSEGGCDSPAHFEGCHVYYIKDGDMDSRWSCGQTDGDCEVDFSLNYYRYVKQVQFAFHQGDEEHVEFKITARTTLGWVTVVPSAISSGDTTTGYQTFDINVHANRIRLIPVFQRQLQWIGINEMVVLERRNNAFVAGTVPVFEYAQSIGFFGDDEIMDIETPTRFRFDLPEEEDWMRFTIEFSEVTAVRIRFPADREFVFQIEYEVDNEDFIDEFTSAGGANTWETFTLSEVSNERNQLTITAVSGPSFVNVPDYPTLRVVDFQIVGEPVAKPVGEFQMVSTNIDVWGVIPDIVADGISDQEDIMKAICETKGSTFDGTDCAGELDDTIVHINMILGDFFIDGPIYIKSGVTLDGSWIDESPVFSFLWLYEGSNFGSVTEDAVIVVDGVTDAEVNDFVLGWDDARTGDIVPGTLGNLGMDVKNSEDLRFDNLVFSEPRTGAVRFADSRNITSFLFFAASPEEGNYMDLIRVDDFSMKAFGGVPGLLIEDCNNIVFEGVDDFGVPTPSLDPPTSATGQSASVVITGASSGIIFRDLEFGVGPEPRVLMESTAPLTLDFVVEYEDGVAGDCMIQVPEGTTEDLIVQINSEETLSKSGNCWVLDEAL